MQVDSPDDSLVREAIVSLGPGAKDFTLDELAAWIRQLEQLCDSRNAAFAPVSFGTDIRGSCRSTFPESGNKPTTTAQTTKLQTKSVQGYPALPELHMEKVSSNKKNARGEAKLRLRVDRGPVLVMLTITDLDGANHTLRAVAVDDNDLIPIKHPGTRIEATVISFAPDELLERLRRVEAKIKPQRNLQVQPSASDGEEASVDVEKAAAQRQADGLKHTTKRVDGRVLEYIFDSEKGTVTMKSSGCCNPYCDEANYKGTQTTYTLNVKTREIETTCKRVGQVIAPILKSFQENPRRQLDLSKRVATVFKEERAIHEKLSTAKPGEAKRLLKELDIKDAEYAKLKDLMFRTAGTGGWLGVPEEERFALLEKATQKDPECVDALARRALTAFNEYATIIAKLESTSSQAKEKRLSKLLVRKEIEFDEAMNDIAVIADGSEEEGQDEDASEQEDRKELNDISIRIACRALAAFDECDMIKEELESTTRQTLKKRIFKLLGHKEIDFDEPWSSPSPSPISPSFWAVAKTKTVARRRTGSE